MNQNTAPLIVEEREEQRFPGVILAAAAALITLAMAAAYVARTTDLGATRLVPAPAVESRDLRFTDLPNSALSVVDTRTNQEIKVLPSDSHGFVRILLKDFALDRLRAGIGSEQPYRLSRLANGQSIIQDTATGRVIILNAFGGSNAAAFTNLMDAGEK